MNEDKTILTKCWNALLNITIGDNEYWIKRNRIPIGTLEPYEKYIDDEGNVNIAKEDIVSVPFDPLEIQDTERKANNILILGGSGDGKGLQMKIIWFFLQKAGYRCVYIDPVSTESGRARRRWDSPRIPPYTEAEGIPLIHYVPEWAIDEEFQNWKHNFSTYASRLKEIYQREMWQGLGIQQIGSIVVSNIIKHYLSEQGKISIDELQNELYELDKKELPTNSYDNVLRVLRYLKDAGVINDNIQSLNLEKHFNENKSVCISYNNASPVLMSFDVGLRIKQCAKINRRINPSVGRRIPIMFFLDDPADYTEDNPFTKFNYATNQIQRIGINYRKLGIFNTLAVQDLKLINEKIASTYKAKLISPVFQSIDQLTSINIPQKAIQYLKSGVLLKDKQHHLLQWLYIDENNEVIPYFPFTPNVNHFTEVYEESFI